MTSIAFKENEECEVGVGSEGDRRDRAMNFSTVEKNKIYSIQYTVAHMIAPPYSII